MVSRRLRRAVSGRTVRLACCVAAAVAVLAVSDATAQTGQAEEAVWEGELVATDPPYGTLKNSIDGNIRIARLADGTFTIDAFITYEWGPSDACSNFTTRGGSGTGVFVESLFGVQDRNGIEFTVDSYNDHTTTCDGDPHANTSSEGSFHLDVEGNRIFGMAPAGGPEFELVGPEVRPPAAADDEPTEEESEDEQEHEVQEEGEDEDGAAAVLEPGVIERDGNLYLNAPEGGVLTLTRADLPEWARDQIAVTGGFIASAATPDRLGPGDRTVTIDGIAVARVNDRTVRGNLVVEGSDRIFVNGVPVAVLGGGVAMATSTAGFVPDVAGVIVLPTATAEEQLEIDLYEINNQLRQQLKEVEEYANRALELLEEDAEAGDTRIEIDAREFEIGDQISIGGPEGDAEIAVVADKGSLILKEPLQFRYPAGALVIEVDPTGFPTIESGDDDGGPMVLLIIGGVAIAAVIGVGVFLGRRRGGAREVGG